MSKITVQDCCTRSGLCTYRMLEIVVAVALIGSFLGWLFSECSVGFALVRSAQANFRASQMLQERVDTDLRGDRPTPKPADSAATAYTWKAQGRAGSE